MKNIVDGNLFGIVECDISVPDHLRTYFTEMQPIFENANISRDDIGEFMYSYAIKHDILKQPRRSLIGSYYGEKIVLATPLLKWYLKHGLVASHVYQIIEYEASPCFASYYGEKIVLATPLLKWYLKHGLVASHVYQIIEYEASPCFASFANTVSDARREGDVHPDKTIIAETMKLIGNSAYGKCATDLSKHKKIIFCNDQTASRGINSHRFRQLGEITETVYQLTLNKKTITFGLPLQIAFMVYQYAKLRMLQFYYDLLDYYIERPLFQYCEMDTDSASLALARSCLDEIVFHTKKELIIFNTGRNDFPVFAVTRTLLNTSPVG